MYAVDHEENDAPFPHPADLGRAGRGAPDGTYATRGAVTQATYESWIASHSAKIASFRATVTYTIHANSLDALIYPTAAPYGSVGNNLRLSPNTGLPALTVPMGQATGTETYAGYGGANLERLGRSYSEPTLIAMSYSYEQATRHRSTPRLSGALPGDGFRGPGADDDPAGDGSVTVTPSAATAAQGADLHRHRVARRG
jgi:amidase